MFEIISEWRDLEAQAFRLVRDKCKSFSESEENLFSEEFKKIEQQFNNIDESFFSYILEEDVNKNSLIIEFSKVYIQLREIKADYTPMAGESRIESNFTFLETGPSKQERAASNDEQLPEEYTNNIEAIKDSFKRKVVKPGSRSTKRKFYDTKVKSLIKEIWAFFPMLNEIKASFNASDSENKGSNSLLSEIENLETSPYYRILADYKALKSTLLKWTEWLINHPFKNVLASPEPFAPNVFLEESFLSFPEGDNNIRQRKLTELSGSTKAGLTPKDLFFMNRSDKLKAMSIHQTELESTVNKTCNDEKIYNFDSQLVLTKFNFKLQKAKSSEISTEKSMNSEGFPYDSSKCVLCNIF